ncbi:MAG: nuclear transport factor 2 family protein [Patulibacter sp.]|nr:nuclear transport factor 2 family protein [Patulibacter sp.]
MSPSETAALRRLLDEAEIRAVIVRFGRAADRNDADLIRSCYHPDATDAHGHYNGDLDGFVAYCGQFTGAVTSLTHFLGQSMIELDGDAAWAETYCLCLIRMPGEDGAPVDRLANIRYVDLFERRDGEWRIARRKVVHHPGRVDPVGIDATFAPEAMLGRMDREDPSYDRRPESFLP